jgi:hypothetical protein
MREHSLMKPCTGKLLFKTKASLLKINLSFFRGTGSPGTFKLGSTVLVQTTQGLRQICILKIYFENSGKYTSL